MGQKLVIGPFNKGLRSDRPAFMIDNDSFPTLINAYQWRGRVKRKRGTTLLGRLTRFLESQSIGVTGASPWPFNIFTAMGIVKETNATVKPGSVQIYIAPTTVGGNIVAGPFAPGVQGYTLAADAEVFVDTIAGLVTGDEVAIANATVVPDTGDNLVNGLWKNVEVIAVNTSFKIHVDSRNWGFWLAGGTWTKNVGGITFIDQGDGTLTSTTPGNSGIINYVTGDIELTHTAGAGIAVDATFEYFPMLPVMGLEDFNYNSNQFPGTIAFDTKYSYNIQVTEPFTIYDVNFYKNPLADGTNLPNYVPKNDGVDPVSTPFVWNGETYQQFWTVNYQGAMWATNGIEVPFRIESIGMQFKLVTNVTIVNVGNGVFGVGNVPAVVTLTIANHGLVIGDFVFLNEFDPAVITGINFQSGYVTAVPDANNVTVTLPFAVLAGAGGATATGLAQYLTNHAFPEKDVIRWYDGDPTLNSGQLGWVNFMPPLSEGDWSISDLPPAQYYLVGGRIIMNFKDRLLIFGPVVQASTGPPIYLQDSIVYSQVGTPYYTASFDGSGIGALTSADTEWHGILLPVNQTATANAWFSDSPGFGGNAQAGIDEPILGVASNEDILIIGFATSQSRLIYSGDDIIPFIFYQINSELGTGSIFSTISMDKGVISRGNRGYILTNQSNAQRIDLEIPDEVFQISLVQNGSERFTAVRDFINEWIYFTYPDDQAPWVYPNQTLLYNYRDGSWAIFNENYTTYGTFRKSSGTAWLDIKFTWENWNVPWNAGSTNTLQPEVIGGNQQGFVMIRDESTAEEPSLAILSFNGSIITVPDFALNDGDFIVISDVIGTIGTEVNGKIFQVVFVMTDIASVNTFELSPNIVGGGTYLGGGLITRLYRPFIKTRQFPVAWADARKTRLGPQQYLFTKTDDKAQVSVLMYLSQDDTTAYNNGPIVPDEDALNDGLIYSTIVYTCQESTNLGLSPANITKFKTNLAMLSSPNALPKAVNNQSYIWHRVNTSLLGDTVQIGITLSDKQMTDVDLEGGLISQDSEIELLGIILDVNPSGVLA